MVKLAQPADSSAIAGGVRQSRVPLHGIQAAAGVKIFRSKRS
jgi:hypothetical protein